MSKLSSSKIEELKDKGNVEALIKLLKKSKDSSVRQEVGNALSEIGDTNTVKPLIAALKDSDADFRTMVAWVLGKLGDSQAVEPLIIALKDNDWRVRKNATQALEELGSPAIEPLITALKDKDVRDRAAYVLGKIGGAQAVEPLVATLGSEIALTRALDSGYTEMAKLLIEKIVDLDWTNLLMKSEVLSDSTLVELLIDKGADVKETGLGALNKAVEEGYYNTVKLLLEKGVKVNYSEEDVISINGQLVKVGYDNSALSDAAARGFTQIVQLLIEAGADVNVKSGGGFTPLMVAAGRGETAIVQLLLEAGADVNSKAKNGDTALYLAQSRGYTETESVIMKYLQ